MLFNFNLGTCLNPVNTSLSVTNEAKAKTEGRRNSNNSRDFALYDGFLRFNRRLLSILRLLKPPLTTNESHSLAALTVRTGEALAKDLVQTLGLEKSTLSRILKQLLSRGLMAEYPSAEDKRRKLLRVTPEGQRVLLDDSRLRNREVEVTVAPLTPGEQKELLRLLQHMADNLGEPKVDDHPEDHPLKREIRRLTRGMGFIGPSCMRTLRPVEECQILRLVTQAHSRLPFSELNRILPYDVSALSRLITNLETKKLIRKLRDSGDQRAVFIEATPSGVRADEQSALRAADFFSAALAGLADGDCERLALIVQRFTEEEFNPREFGTTGDYQVVALNADDQRERYRALLIESAVRNNHHHHLPETILGTKSLCIAIERGNEPIAISELQRTGTKASLTQLVFFGTAAKSPDEQSAVTERILDYVATSGRCSALDIHDPLFEPLIPRIFPRTLLPRGGLRIALRRTKKI